MFDFLSNLLPGNKAVPPPVQQDADHASGTANAAAPAAGAVDTSWSIGGFHPITAAKSVAHWGQGMVDKGVHAVEDGVHSVVDAATGVVHAAQDAYHKHEQVKAAEASREQLHEKMDKLGDLPADQKERILKRTKGLTGDALITEMATIESALKGKNADRALATYAELDEMVAKNPEAKGRIDSNMMAKLVTGVASSRTDSDRGQSGILGARQARDSAQALINMSGDEFTKTQQLLDQAGKGPDGKPAEGSDTAAEQALILKAVGARRDEYKHGLQDVVDAVTGKESPSDKANQDLEQFAKDIRGMKRDDLIQNTTLIDIDDKNTSSTDPDSNKGGDTKTDNDGLFQRFTTTCGPTTSQMVRGEVDPIYALKLRQNHFNDSDPNSEYAQEQKKVLEANGGVAVSRLGTNAQSEVTTQLDTLKTSKAISGDQYLSVKQLMSGATLSATDSVKAQADLAAVRAKNGGSPTDAEIAAMKQDAGKSAAGMVLDPALNTIAGGQTHLDYQGNGVAAGGISTSQMSNTDKMLKDGQEVPIRIGGTGNSGHFMMVSDVRGAPGADRKYLVSDPWSGATRWVPEADFQSGAFTTTQFQLGTAGVTHLYGDKSQTF